MPYVLGTRSMNELKGVHDDLVSVVKKAIIVVKQDFSVHDGIRSADEQKALVDKGASHTMRSQHLIGHAVDLVPYINGKLRWEWAPIYEIAASMRWAAQCLGVPVVWGGAWDLILTDTSLPIQDLVDAYADRRRKDGKRVFLDGPHFELSRNHYSQDGFITLGV